MKQINMNLPSSITDLYMISIPHMNICIYDYNDSLICVKKSRHQVTFNITWPGLSIKYKNIPTTNFCLCVIRNVHFVHNIHNCRA